MSVDLGERSYVRNVIDGGAPFVSEGLKGAVSGHRLIVTAVPTRDAAGAITGVLAGGLLVEPQAPDQQALDLGYAGLAILDRDGKSLLGDFAAPRNTALTDRVRNATPGVLADTTGLDGSGDRVVAYATSALPGWTVVIDRSRSAIFGAAWRSFLFELALIAGVALAVLAIAGAAIARARRSAQRRSERARQHGVLVRKLAAASVGVEVAEALVGALEDAERGTRVAVAWAAHDRLGVRIAAASADLDAPAGDEAALTETLELPYASGVPLSIPTEERLQAGAAGAARCDRRRPLRLRGAARRAGRRARRRRPAALRPAHRARRGVPGPRRRARRAGRRGAGARPLPSSRSTTSRSRLQRSLLPAQLPEIAGLDLAGRYRAGTGALEVGGDWYDVVRRPDGIVHLIVGDVAGRGVNAAILMGRLRTAFRAYAFDDATAGDVLRHLLRHVAVDEHGDRRLRDARPVHEPGALRVRGPPVTAAAGRRRRHRRRTSTGPSRRRSASSARTPSARSGSCCRRARRWSRTPTASSSAATPRSTPASTA